MTAATTAADAPGAGLARLRAFVTAFAELVETADDEAAILARGGALLARLVARDDWLPDAFAVPHPLHYQQYLLHCDSRERFCVVAFVWGPGQGTPIHDHRVWGLIGMLRGCEQSERYHRLADGRLQGEGPGPVLRPGAIEAVSPCVGDLHRVWNVLADAPSISIHVYGANIGAVRRATYQGDGTAKPFVSGYASAVLPNLWQMA